MWQGPRDIDLRVEAFLEMFEKKLVEMTIDEFQVRAVIIPVGCICTRYNSLTHVISRFPPVDFLKIDLIYFRLQHHSGPLTLMVVSFWCPYL